MGLPITHILAVSCPSVSAVPGKQRSQERLLVAAWQSIHVGYVNVVVPMADVPGHLLNSRGQYNLLIARG